MQLQNPVRSQRRILCCSIPDQSFKCDRSSGKILIKVNVDNLNADSITKHFFQDKTFQFKRGILFQRFVIASGSFLASSKHKNIMMFNFLVFKIGDILILLFLFKVLLITVTPRVVATSVLSITTSKITCVLAQRV